MLQQQCEYFMDLNNQKTKLAKYVRACLVTSVVSDSVTLYPVAGQAPLSMDSLGKNTEVGCHFLLQGIFLTQGLNPCPLCLLHWQVQFFFFFFTTSTICKALFRRIGKSRSQENLITDTHTRACLGPMRHTLHSLYIFKSRNVFPHS